MALKRLALGSSTKDDFEIFSNRRHACLTADENRSFDENLHLFTTNSAVAELNLTKLKRNNKPVLVSNAKNSSCRGDDEDSESFRHSGSLLLSENVPVMLKKNICVDAGLVNGSRGRVRAIIKPHLEAEGLVAMVLVELPSYCGPPPFQNDPQVVPIVASSILGKIQIPLDLAWATTVHKSQGLTLDKVTVHLGDKEYAAGLYFVALSRVRKLSDLRVTSFDFSRISSMKSMKTSQERIKEFKRLKDLASRADR